MVTCGVAIRTERLKDHLPLPLETAHLILVQHMPLSIRFRFDRPGSVLLDDVGFERGVVATPPG